MASSPIVPDQSSSLYNMHVDDSLVRKAQGGPINMDSSTSDVIGENLASTLSSSIEGYDLENTDIIGSDVTSTMITSDQSMPQIQMPQIQMPQIQMPQIQMPPQPVTRTVQKSFSPFTS